MLACKSDPDIAHRVAAVDGNALAEPFNIGLIEVTTATADGRGKIRNGLRWLLYKLEQRHRRPSMNIGSNQMNGVSGRNRREPVVNSIIAPSPASSHHPSIYTETIKSPETDSSFGARRLVSHHHIGMSATNSTQSTDSEMRRNSSSLTWMKKAPLRYPGGPMELASGSSDQGSLARESLEIIGTSEPSEDTHATR